MGEYATPEIQRVMEHAHAVYPELEAVAPGLPTVAGVLAVGLGMLREIYACPNCPGAYRQPIPPENGVERIYCAQCGGVWHYMPDATPPPPKQRRARKKQEAQ